MSFYEPLEVDRDGRHRMDLLGWYSQCVDLGWHVDIVHPDQAASGALNDYSHLIVPHNSLYHLGDNAALESAVNEFVSRGGSMFHGPDCQLALRTFGIREEPTEFDCIAWEESLIPHGWSTVAWASGDAVGRYVRSDKIAIARTAVGNGQIHSFGFQYGYSYSRRTMPIVPPQYGNREMHPLVLLKRTPVAAALGTCPHAPMPPTAGVEMARFGKHLIMVNHRAGPIDLRSVAAVRMLSQVPFATGWLPARSAAYLQLADNSM
jgi:hypothetical protein